MFLSSVFSLRRMTAGVVLVAGSMFLTGISECSQADEDGDGWSVEAGDCDDADPGTHPDAYEACDGKDNDCDGTADEGVQLTYYADADGDGYGDPAKSIEACTRPAGYVTNPQDCDDRDASTRPGALEECDGQDNDCDGSVDVSAAPLFVDLDGDGFGDEEGGRHCGDDLSFARGDCDDSNPAVHPGALDPFDDGLDRDCGGSDGPEPHVGLSSSTFTDLQLALDAAPNGITVWVGPGTWPVDRLSFRGKAVRLASTHLAGRTAFSRNYAWPAVLFDQGEGPDTRLDAFTLTGPAYESWMMYPQGAMRISAASPTIVDCVISGNFSSSGGGGIYMTDSSPTFVGCSISDNETVYLVESVPGGGIYMERSSPTFIDTELSGNVARSSGGGVYMWESDALFSGCRISGNAAHGPYGTKGGGLSLYRSSVTLEHCELDGNLAKYTNSGQLTQWAEGAALYLHESSAELRHCTLSGNQGVGVVNGPAALLALDRSAVVANNQGLEAVAGPAIRMSGTTPIDIRSSILAYNTGGNLSATPEMLTLLYSDLFNPPGLPNHDLSSLPATNTTAEPGFLRYAEATGAGCMPGSSLSCLPVDLHLALESMLIDAGDPALLDVDGSRSDVGIFGGPEGDGWDRDRDTVPDWFWPGTIEDAPLGFDPGDWDCDDFDASIRQCGG